ncbi:uncharacterized protein DS421_12g371600 [Arachis hypogaea]|nr:uncharacterized protein DS421_12g371600 [Arachis hypogaea]
MIENRQMNSRAVTGCPAMERSKTDWMKIAGKQRFRGTKSISIRLSEILTNELHNLLHTNNLRGIRPLLTAPSSGAITRICSSLEITISCTKEHGTIVNNKVFEMNGKKQALVQFETEEQATEALVCKHARPLSGSVIRISFSQLQNI